MYGDGSSTLPSIQKDITLISIFSFSTEVFLKKFRHLGPFRPRLRCGRGLNGYVLALLISTAFGTSGEDSMTTHTPSEKELQEMVKSLFPVLDESKHKGEAGRLAVIGGSEE